MRHSFNPSRGIAIIQTCRGLWQFDNPRCFNPSRGIAIIQTRRSCSASLTAGAFQSLTRDSNHSNSATHRTVTCRWLFQSLTRDSNHSNTLPMRQPSQPTGFNPSRGIAIIQTHQSGWFTRQQKAFQSLTRDSNHLNSSDAVQSA